MNRPLQGEAYGFEPSLRKVLGGVVRETLLVELALKVLERQGIVQDGRVAAVGRVEVGTLHHRGRSRGAGRRKGQKSRRVTHGWLGWVER